MSDQHLLRPGRRAPLPARGAAPALPALPHGRRALLLGGGAALAMPAISYGQSEAIRIGHLTPRTGFLGPLGEFAVQAVQLAAEEINAAGGVLGRRIELLVEDSGNPPTGSAQARRAA